MAFNSKKVEKMVREKGLKGKVFFGYVYPDRSNSTNASLADISKNTNPKADTIERIADLLQCSIDELFERDSNYVINNSNNTIMGDNNSVGNVQISNNPEALMAVNNSLRDIIARQDKTIADLNNRIDQLIELARR